MKNQSPYESSPDTIPIGGETYKGQDDYLKTINSIFNKIVGLSISNDKLSAMFWDLNYCTDLLINSIIDSKERDLLAQAKVSLYQYECLKMVDDPTKYKTLNEVKKALDEADLNRAGIESCMRMIGECRTYFDKYFGLEQKLAVMTE